MRSPTSKLACAPHWHGCASASHLSAHALDHAGALKIFKSSLVRHALASPPCKLTLPGRAVDALDNP